MPHDRSSESSAPPDPAVEDARWLVIDGRRWRRTDPELPSDLVEALKSQLGRGRSDVRSAKASGAVEGDEVLVAARRRVNLAKHGLGERGPYWWDEPVAARVSRAHDALRELERL